MRAHIVLFTNLLKTTKMNINQSEKFLNNNVKLSIKGYNTSHIMSYHLPYKNNFEKPFCIRGFGNELGVH